ncbi:MAG: hypothetical protein ACSHWZ_17320 [Sulfitobacter sp.]
MSRPTLAALTAILAICFALSPFLTPGFGGFDPDQFPVPQVNPPVQPAGYAFAIWGLIYIWLVLGMGWGYLNRRSDAGWHALRSPLALSLAMGCFWLAVALYSPIWASVLIWAMLAAALAALFRAPQREKYAAAWPVGLYAGWLSAASCVSLGLLAAGYGWVGPLTAAYGAILLALLIATSVQYSLLRSPTYGLGVIWALIAVIVQNLGENPLVWGLAAGGAIALIHPTWQSWQAER